MNARRRTRVSSPRGVAAVTVLNVVEHGRSLNDAMPDVSFDDPRDLALARELSAGTLRHYWALARITDRRLKKPLKQRDADVLSLLHVGLYQLRETRIKGHAAVNATVEVTKEFDKPWARGLVNAVLRGEQRDPTPAAKADDDPQATWNHPAWLIDAITANWDDAADGILEGANARAPMTLRVNQSKTTRDQLLNDLADAGITATAHADGPDALTLSEPCSVSALPGFSDGLVSVQDLSAQLVADTLDLAPGQRVLDACAAPGGKTAHMIERCPELAEVVAVDSVETRLERVHSNLERIDLDVPTQLLVADARQRESWWDNHEFDRILVDAPCSGTGVISRHPDIKHLRRPSDIDDYVKDQLSILDAVWPTLKSGGRLVYATCSVLKEENARCLDQFISHTPDVEPVELGDAFGQASGAGRQRLPGRHSGDGFFYAAITKA